jgi:hypothetical protein
VADARGPYKVVVVWAAKNALVDLLNRADAVGAGPRARECLLHIERELQERPLEWGEPAFHVRSMALISCVGFRDRIRVDYSVHERNPVVYIRLFEPQLGHPLFVPPAE